MAKGKDILTTGDVARICHVAPRTVSKWFDSGQLRGYRIPGSRDRRIPVTELMRFMKENGMPTDALGVGNSRILIVDTDTQAAEQLAYNLAEKADYDVETVGSTFETGLAAHKFAPHVMLISLLSAEIDASQISQTVREDEELQTIKLLAVADQLSEPEQNALLHKGFDGFIPRDAPIEEIIRRIEQATAIIY